MSDAQYKIGSVAKMTGLSPFLLRAWENRYGLLKPRRSETGLRYYSDADVESLRVVKQLLDTGYTIGEVSGWDPAQLAAAREAADRRGPAPAATAPPGGALVGIAPDSTRDAGRAALFETARARLLDAARRLDRQSFDSALAEASAAAPFGAVVAGVLMPLLQSIGDEWQRGSMSVASEHFATAAIRQRLLAMIQATAPPAGPAALVACAPGDYHEIGALYGTFLYARDGWAVTYLGANLPVEEFATAIESVRPDLVGFSVVVDVPRETFASWLDALDRARKPGARIVCGGRGARAHADVVLSRSFELDASFEARDRRGSSEQGAQADAE